MFNANFIKNRFKYTFFEQKKIQSIFRIQIYKKNTIENLMTLETVDNVIAEAKIKQIFDSFSKTTEGRRKRRAGCEVTLGELSLGRGIGFKVLRNGEELYRDEKGLAELRRGKEPTTRVPRGDLCGVDLRDCEVHRAGDVVQLFRVEIKRGRVRVAID